MGYATDIPYYRAAVHRRCQHLPKGLGPRLWTKTGSKTVDILSKHARKNEAPPLRVKKKKREKKKEKKERKKKEKNPISVQTMLVYLFCVLA